MRLNKPTGSDAGESGGRFGDGHIAARALTLNRTAQPSSHSRASAAPMFCPCLADFGPLGRHFIVTSLSGARLRSGRPRAGGTRLRSWRGADEGDVEQVAVVFVHDHAGTAGVALGVKVGPGMSSARAGRRSPATAGPGRQHRLLLARTSASAMPPQVTPDQAGAGGRAEGASRPRARADPTASDRLCAPSLAYTLRRWVLTVLVETDSSPAISGADKWVGR